MIAAGPIPKEWLEGLTPLQKRVILHWTVTGYEGDEHCLDSYHFIITGKGEIKRGNRDIDEPAPHTYMLNSAIGISICAMGNWDGHSTPYPPTKAQWDTLVSTCRQLAVTYGIPCTRSHILMHGEVTEVFGPNFDQWGKWDIGYLPHAGIQPETGRKCGDLLRKEVALPGTRVPVRSPALEKDPMVKVSVRLQGSSKVMDGFLFDGSSYVPLRAFINWAKEKLPNDDIDLVVQNKNFYIGAGNKDVIEGTYRNIGGTGYAALKNLTDYLGLKIVIETWTKDKRIVVVKK